MKKNLFNKTIVASCIALTLSTVSVFAATLMSYRGTEIRGKYSVNSFSTNSTQTVKINHSNDSWNNVPSSAQYMQVQVCKKKRVGFYGKTGMQFNASGVGSTTQSYSVAPGTYKLYFHAPVNPAAADISGYVSN